MSDPDPAGVELVTGGLWRLYRPDGGVAADAVRFLPDGFVSGYASHDEARWIIADGILCLATPGGEITTRFADVAQERIRVVLRGRYKDRSDVVLALERRGMSRALPSSLARLRCIEAADYAALEALGLSPTRVAALFAGKGACVLAAGTPPIQAQGVGAEFAAAGFAFALIQDGFTLPDLRTGAPARCVAGLTRGDMGDVLDHLLPFFYRIEDADRRVFWLVSYNVSGRIGLIYLPDEAVAIVGVDWPEPYVRAMLRELEVAADLAGPSTEGQPRPVAVLDMADGSGHQLINHLSAVERLLQSSGHHGVDEIWLSGTEFFGWLEEIFPELEGKVRRFASRWDMAAALREDRVLPLRIGSAHVPASLVRRLHEVAEGAGARYTRARPPRTTLIAFTLRFGDRQCLNMVEVVVQTVTTLLRDFPDLGVVFDGWVIPRGMLRADSATYTLSSDPFHRNPVQAAHAMIQDIEQRLPRGVVARNLIGETMPTSINGLRDIAAYVAHVGTLQHKVAFLSGAPGLIHGPRRQLAEIEVGPYYAEDGVPPVFLDPSSVADEAETAGRGERANHYRISDIDQVARLLRPLLLRSHP